MFDTVFFVDDDPITIMLCKKVIEKSSFSNNIVTAQNGEEAIHFFELLTNNTTSKIPEIIFLDLNMPIMDGWEFLDIYLKRNYHSIFPSKFFVLSSTIDPQDIEKSKSYPMVIDFLSKPITKEILEKINLMIQL
jgi:CheY-like chemotaxis protein